MKMKRRMWVLAGALLLFAGCAPAAVPSGSPSAAEAPPEENAALASPEKTSGSGEEALIVFAAASLQETLDEVGEMRGRPIEFNFDSSGTLKTQIEEGAECDVFISASPRQINELKAAGMLEDGSERDLLENRVVLATTEGNPSELTGFDDLARRLKSGEILLAVGNSDVPVGQYTQEIFAYLGLDERELAETGVLSYGTNVKEVTTQVAEGSVDAGIIYATDAYSASLQTVAEATTEMCGEVVYPGAVLAASSRPERAREFLDYLGERACAAVFEEVGFVMA